MARDFWLLPRKPYCTVRLRDVPYDLYRELARRAAEHRTPFTLTREAWSYDRPEAFLRVARRKDGQVSSVTFIFELAGDSPWLDVPEPETELYYSGAVGYDEVTVRVLSYISALLDWPAEDSDHAS